MTDDEDAQARRERAEALRHRFAKDKAGDRSGTPSSPHEFVVDEMRNRERADEHAGDRPEPDPKEES